MASRRKRKNTKGFRRKVEMQQEGFTIFVGNLDEKVTEELLYELFLQAGPLEGVRIPTGNDGVSRNFGFVVFLHEESLPYAIKLLDQIPLYGRPIFLKDAHSRQQNYSPRGPPPRMSAKERLGPRPIEDVFSLREAPGSIGRRYSDMSMQPNRPSRNKERYEEDLRHRYDWGKPPGSLNLYPSQKCDGMKGHNSNNGSISMKHRSRNNHGGFSQFRKPYEKTSHHRESNRYEPKHFRRSN